jgi:hypothetical protein
MPHNKSRLSTIRLILVILSLTALQIFLSFLLFTSGPDSTCLLASCGWTFSSLTSKSMTVLIFLQALLFFVPIMPMILVIVSRFRKINAWVTAPLLLIWALPIINFSVGGRLGLVGCRNFNTFAQTAGRYAKLAEEVYYLDHGGDVSGGYANSLGPLQVLYRDVIIDDHLVTFSFGTVTTSGYTFTTTHKCSCGKKVFTFTD